MGAVAWKVFCVTTLTVIISISFYEIIWNLQENRCAMTWMYEWPEYMKVDLPSQIQKRYPKYALFVYGEGRYAEYLKSTHGNYQLDGIPVVFVHGNAGRYKQVRSPASVSLRKSDTSEYHFNYFTVDYREELSALYGPYLRQQTEYLAHAITRILQCYSHLQNKPRSVITIGHSMGGLVIRGLFTLNGFDPATVNTIINLATPQTHPLITLDPALHSYYRDVNKYWAVNFDGKLENITVVSVSGGVRDYLVRSDLCTLDSIINNTEQLSLLTGAVPLVWRSTDHQCIVWCNQLVRLLTRSFFQMINQTTRQITSDSILRRSIMKEQFARTNPYTIGHRYSNVSYVTTCTKINVDASISTYRGKRGQCFYLDGSEYTVPNNDSAVVNIWVQGQVSKWLYTCEKHSISCRSADTVDMLLPRGENGATTFVQNTLQPSNVSLLQFTSNVEFRVQAVHKKPPVVRLPGFLTKTFLVKENTFHARFTLASFTESWQVYDIVLKRSNTDIAVTNIVANSIAQWSGESNYFTFDSPHSVFRLHFFHEKPISLSNQDKHVQLELWGDELDGIEIVVKPAFSSIVGHLFRFNIQHIVRYVLVFRLLTFLLTTYLSYPILAKISFPQLKKFHVFGLLLLLLKLLLHPTEYLTLLTLNRYVLRQTYILLFSYMTGEALTIILKVAILLVTFTSYPVYFTTNVITAWISKRYTNGETVDAMKFRLVSNFVLLYSSFVPLFAILYFYQVNIAVILFILLYYNIYKLRNLQNTSAKKLHTNILLSISPVIIIFSCVPVLTILQDITEGFAVQTEHFFNLQVMGFVYVLYLLSDFESYRIELSCGILGMVVKALVFVCVLFCFASVVPLYCLCYAVAACLLLVIVGSLLK